MVEIGADLGLCTNIGLKWHPIIAQMVLALLEGVSEGGAVTELPLGKLGSLGHMAKGAQK